MSQTHKTNRIILYAFFAALTAVCSWISIPLPFSPVPINLATLSVFLAGGLLGASGGAVSQIVFVFLGAVGLPVFHSFTGGIGAPLGNKKPPLLMGAGKLALALLSCYVLGTAWFMFLTGTGLMAALFLCVFPFLPGDALKIIAALLLIRKLSPHLGRQI